MKRLLPAILLSAALLSAQDVAAGAWSMSCDVQGLDWNETCTFVQTDAKLAGPCTGDLGKWDTTGSVDGKKITFKHGGEYEGQALTLTYSAVIGDDGTLKGTISVDPLAVDGAFTAKKVVAKPAPAPAM